MNKLLINSRYIEIRCDRNDTKTQELAESIPYVHRNRIRTVYRTTVKNIDMVMKLFRTVEYGDPIPSEIKEIWDKQLVAERGTTMLFDNGPSRPDDWKFRAQNFIHQQLGRELAEYNDRYAFFYDTRTGKTLMSLQIIADDLEKNPGNKWLVLCPLILIEEAWLEDASKFFPHLSIISLHDSTKARRLKRFNTDANIYVQNIESFISYREYIDKLNVHGCVVDESSTMKSHKSKFGKEAVDFSKGLDRWYLLSGTPAPNGEYEYYRQIQSVDYYGVHQSWSQFKDYFFINTSYNPQYDKLILNEEKREEFTNLLRRYSIYVDKEDVLNTPGKEFIPYTVEMPAKLAEQYHQLRREMYVELEDEKRITAMSAAIKADKLNQVTSGFVIDSKEGKAHLLSTYRFEKLEELLNSFGDKQAIVWCNYKAEFEIIKERLGDRCACVYGDISIQDKKVNIKNFKEGRVQFLIANPASADKGLTLTNAHIAVYFSLRHSLELFEQSVDRIYGDKNKQPNKCLYYIMMAKDTIDKPIYNTMLQKGDMSITVLNHLKGGI